MTKLRGLAAPVGAALFALRVSLETTPARPLWGTGAAVFCLLAAYVLRARRAPVSLAPLGFTWVYVAWPTASPAMALGVGFVGVVGVLVGATCGQTARAGTHAPPLVWDALLFVAALALYLFTLAPDLLPADSGEFQIVGPLLGVAHPPGYALFTLLAKGFSLLPIGTMPWRLNLMGAVTGALTLVVVARTARRITFDRRSAAGSESAAGRAPAPGSGTAAWAGIAAAGALGLSTTFWAQSTTINIRMLSTLFVALCLAALIRYLQAPTASPESQRALTGFAFSFGLAVAHTAWPAFFAPVFGAVLLWRDPGLLKRVRQWPRPLLAFALPFLGHLYIVLRAIGGAPFGAEELVDAGRVIDHLLGRGFGGDMFAFLRLDRILWERTLVVGNILRFQFDLPLLLIALVGFLWLVRKRGRIALLLGSVLGTMAFIVATYRAPQSVEYLMPAYLPIALSIGVAVGKAASLGNQTTCGSSRRRHAPPAMLFSKSRIPAFPNSLLLSALLLPILLLGLSRLPSYRALHHDRTARAYAELMLLKAPPEAHILSNWHWYTPLRYLQLVEGKRPDVKVTYLYPQGATAMPQAWPQRIERELRASDRPLIVTNAYPTYGDLPYRFEPLGEALIVRPSPSREPPAGLVTLNVDWFEDDKPFIRLLGYNVQNEGTVRPGDRVTVDLAWQPLAPLGQPYAFFVHLVGADGVPLGQRDRRHDRAETYEPGEVLIDRYSFPVYLTAAPGTYRLIVGVYLPFENGSWVRLTTEPGHDTLSLADVAIAAPPTAPVTLHPLYVPFGTGRSPVDPVLVGLDYDDTLPNQRRVYLHWRAGEWAAQAQLHSGQTLVAAGTVPGAYEDAPLTDRAGRGYVTVALDVPAGTRGLYLALQREGRTLPARGAWGIPRERPQPLPDPGPGRAHYVPFGGELALIGARTGGSWAPGGQGRVALRFLGLRPIVRDYVVSVGVQGSAATDAPSDGVPAIGAMPTFKWIGGSVVNDVHLIRILEGGEARLSVGLYDAFTTGALPPLDERIAQLGRAGVPLDSVSIP